ncbi:MAG: LytTR family transcriptional regulator [Clostridia bacterium]|nr:LytTR family transcriptional regulator [Clostridia bacterium]
MKCQTIVDAEREEEVLIYVHKKSELSDKIEAFVNEASTELIGYGEKTAVKLELGDVFCFTVEDGKVYALTENEKYRLKQRLYLLEEMLDKSFVKINQSCIANIRKIQKFDASLAGTLTVIFKNGYRDYVSRRQLKTVKERIGF